LLPYIYVFGLEVPMYGLMLAVGLTLGILVDLYFAKRSTLDSLDVEQAMVYAGVGAFLGAKILYLLTVLPDLIEKADVLFSSFDYIFMLLSRGLVFYGGLIGGLSALIVFCKTQRIDVWEMFAAILPGVPLAHSIGRIGCFLAGCCYGVPADPPWGVFFKPGSAAPAQVSLFPIQLLEAALNMLLFIALFIFARKRRKPGYVPAFYLIGYSVQRFILEFFRYDVQRGVYFGLSTSQWISAVLLAAAVLMIILPNRRKKAKDSSI
jgi:phosphatidylglycerol:prolipoprotein diacylglycerol transferase